MTNESLIITNNFKIRFLQIHFTQKIQIPEQKKLTHYLGQFITRRKFATKFFWQDIDIKVFMQ